MRPMSLTFRNPTLQAVVLGVLFCAYTAVLLQWNFKAEQEVREAAEQGLRLEVEKRAQTAGYLFQRWQEDVERLARAPEIGNYYTNQALGMSMEYGLRASLLAIRRRLDAFTARHADRGTATVEAVALLERDGSTLLRVGPQSLDPARAAGGSVEDRTAGIDAAPGGTLVIHAPVMHKGDYQGQIVVCLGPRAVAELVLGRPQSHGVAGDYLLGADDGIILPRQADGILPPMARDPACPDCPSSFQGPGPTRSRGSRVQYTVLTAPVSNTPFRLAVVRPSSEVFPGRTSPAVLATAGALPLVAIVALVMITRIRASNRDLKQQFDASQRQERLLREEIGRRERVEAELRENQSQLRERGYQLQQAMDDAHRLAFYDPLTGLANRTLFRERLVHALEAAQRENLTIALLFLDLDRFKRINDTLGHHLGDLLLQKVASRLKHSVRSRDLIAKVTDEAGERIIARQGGDEFTVVLTSVGQPEHITRVAKRLLDAVARPMILEELEVSVTTSIGVSICPPDEPDIETLIKNADAAMYSAKAKGGNSFCFYERSMNEVARQRLEQESDLRRALQRDELSVCFQPQIAIASGEVVGAEALVRWNHPDKGKILPGEFIATAEESRLINPLTEYVLRCACTAAARWPTVGGRAPRVAVNLSGRSFSNYDICAAVEGILAESGLAPERLELEITETVLLENRAQAEQILQRLNRLGVRTAIDDFGTGYSSLSYLKSFPIQSLKIDRSFIADIEADGNDAAIVRAIIAMAETLELETVAEGVESKEQAEFLRGLGCTLVQGFLYSKPLPPAAFERYLTGAAAPLRLSASRA